jgi:hypothetical protein
VILPLRIAQLVAASYTAAPSWSATWPEGRARAVATIEGDTTVIAFPGTQTLADWFVDFRAYPATVTDYPIVGRCHAGFIQALARIAPQILADTRGKRVFVAGHSLGGALAQLFAGILAGLGRAPDGLWTFGAARCMADTNDFLAPLLAGIPGLDYRHRDDPVPFLLAGFAHPRPLTQLVPMSFELDVVADHFIDNYVQALAV